MRRTIRIGALTIALGAAVAHGAAGQEDPYRSVAFDDPYFTRPAPAEPTPTFGTAPQLARARPALPEATPRAVAAPTPTAMPLRAGAEPSTPPPVAGRLMRGRIEAVVGWDGLGGEDAAEGVTYGVAVGADRVVGHLGGGALFLGPYGAARFSEAERASTGLTEATEGAVTTATRTDAITTQDREIELGARLGWATDRAAVYASVGYVDARAGTARAVSITTTDGAAGTSDTATERTAAAVSTDGWRVGGGAEVTLAADLYWKAEYGYTLTDEAETDRHQVTTGLGLRF